MAPPQRDPKLPRRLPRGVHPDYEEVYSIDHDAPPVSAEDRLEAFVAWLMAATEVRLREEEQGRHWLRKT